MQADSLPSYSKPSLAPAASVILIIDDNPKSIKALSLLVRDFGEVIFATSGAAGIAMAMKRNPDLILLDVEMPGMNGYEVCRQLKADLSTRGSSIIIVTSHSSVEHEVEALEAGAADFITKPLNSPLVRARVKTQLLVKKQADELQRLAEQDGLTGIYNRRYFDEQMAQEWRRHQRQRSPLGVALVDVDYFKAYNDEYGHQGGDGCLRAVAQCLTLALRRPGEQVARYGGEEFVIILPYTDNIELLKIGPWLCEQVRSRKIPHAKSAVAQWVTISVGLASCTPSIQTGPDHLLGLADKALYQAKASGRNQCVVAEKTLE
ncbi:MAG: diguanylate cyclase [Pseudomonadota bacterium]|nr:diguanylate cyclase [Pseudomonadota bacterium]